MTDEYLYSFLSFSQEFVKRLLRCVTKSRSPFSLTFSLSSEQKLGSNNGDVNAHLLLQVAPLLRDN
jgi:hypothetical protein